MRYVSNIWSLFVPFPDNPELLLADLYDLGTIGIEETPDGFRAYFEDTTNAAAVRNLLSYPNAAIETSVPSISVQEASDRDPILIGTRFVLVPADRIVLPIDAAMAFGSGRHESTQLCLQALEQNLLPGQTVFDVGCGSGILSLAALKLGATRVIAADIDESSIAVARLHFPGPLFVGSADCFPAQTADLVLSNISGKINDHISADLKRIAKPNGVIVISGFTAETAPANFRPAKSLTLGDWHCWICHPSDIVASRPEADPNVHAGDWWL